MSGETTGSMVVYLTIVGTCLAMVIVPTAAFYIDKAARKIAARRRRNRFKASYHRPKARAAR